MPRFLGESPKNRIAWEKAPPLPKPKHTFWYLAVEGWHATHMGRQVKGPAGGLGRLVFSAKSHGHDATWQDVLCRPPPPCLGTYMHTSHHASIRWQATEDFRGADPVGPPVCAGGAGEGRRARRCKGCALRNGSFGWRPATAPTEPADGLPSPGKARPSPNGRNRRMLRMVDARRPAKTRLRGDRGHRRARLGSGGILSENPDRARKQA